MKIEQFVAQSEGVWRSMRTSHSLAFQQFEEVISQIEIKRLEKSDPRVFELRMLSKENFDLEFISPFLIEWKSDSDWDTDKSPEQTAGSCLLIPCPTSKDEGLMIRSLGYAETIMSNSRYQFFSDETFCITNKYENSLAEERIWFLSNNVRCRSSVIRSKDNMGILQTSFSSEVRDLSR